MKNDIKHDNKIELMNAIQRIRLRDRFGTAVLIMGIIVFLVVIYLLFTKQYLPMAIAAMLDGVYLTIGWKKIIKDIFG